MENNDNLNMLESILIKLEAHKGYIVPRLKDEEERLQATISFDTIIDHVVELKKAIEPETLKSLSFFVSDDKTHKNVLDTYEDIYYNMFKRFYGRSEDAYLEKL
jgi:hypothetical protein